MFPMFRRFAMPRLAPIACMLACAVMLGGCERLPVIGKKNTAAADAIACPAIAVRDDFEEITLTGEVEGQSLHIRLDGVEARCTDGGDAASLNLEMFVDLLVTREEDVNLSRRERAEFNMTFAFVDASGAVVSRFVYSEDVTIKPSRRDTRPTAVLRTPVPRNTRIVFGLGSAAE